MNGKKKMDKRTLLAVSLSFLIFLGWQKYYIEPRLPKKETTISQNTPSNNAVSTQDKNTFSNPPNSSAAPIPSEEIEFQTKVGHGKIGNGKKFFTSFELEKYTDSHIQSHSKIQMTSVTPEIPSQVELAFDSTEFAYINSVNGKFTKNENNIVWTFEDERIKLQRIFNLDSKNTIVDVEINALFKMMSPKNAFISLETEFPEKDAEEQDRQLLAFSMGSLERKHHKDIKNLEDIPGPIDWVGAQNRYFLLSILPEKKEVRALLQNAGEKKARLSLVFPVNGNQFSEKFKVYFGPKDVELLSAISPTLSKTVDYGVFSVIAKPILIFMKWLYSILGNWGFAIIVLTLAIKVATFPLTYKSMKSMKNMAKMQPELEKIRTKYKDDKETLNRELMTFMKTKGYNPVSGCLPMLIQMPVFFALYRVLYSSIELYQAPFMFWIKDLSLKDPFYITPVILTGVMWLQQKLTPNTVSDPMQAKMMQFMPLFFGFMMISLPAGLTIYMLVNALASIAQQIYINKKLDPSKGSEPVVLTS